MKSLFETIVELLVIVSLAAVVVGSIYANHRYRIWAVKQAMQEVQR